MDWFSIAYVLEAGSSNSWPWFYWLWQETFAFLAILFTMDISVTRPPLPFRCKGSLLSTSTLLQVKSSFSYQATRQDSLRGKLHLGAQSLSSEFPALTSLRPHAAHQPCDLAWAHSLSLHMLLLQSTWTPMLLSLHTFIVCTVHILTESSSFTSLL